MPIRIKTDLEWGQVFYLKSDPYQKEYNLVGIGIDPPNQLKFYLRHNAGEVKEVYDFEATPERDEVKALSNTGDEDDGD